MSITIKKRCPNGTRRNKKTQKCEPKNVTKYSAIEQKSPLRKKRCPNGTRRNKKTQKCEPKHIKEQRETLLKDIVISPLPYPLSSKEEEQEPISLIEQQSNLFKKTFYTPFCKNENISPYINLKNIYVVGPTFKNKRYNKEYLLVYKNKENNKNIILDHIKYINSGAHGSIYKIFDKKENIVLTMKKMNNYNDEEYKIIKLLERKKTLCDILNVKIVNFNPKERVVIYNFFNDSLNELYGKLEFGTCLEILKKLTHDLKCLYDDGFVYTDLKGGNVLYKCTDSNSFEIKLADLGSICKINSKNLSTILPWDQRSEKPYEIKCKQSSVVWSLAVLFLELLSNFRESIKIHNIFTFNNIITYSKEEINREIVNIIDHYKLNHILLKDNSTIGQMIKNMLELDPKKRITLEKLLNIL